MEPRVSTARQRSQARQPNPEPVLSGLMHSVFFQGGVATIVLSVAAVLIFSRSQSATRPYNRLDV